MAYTTIDNSELYFQTKLYAGNGSSQSITLDGSENMQPDWVCIKSRTDTRKHNLYDVVRGTNKRLVSNADSAEDEPDSNAGVNAFNSDGFTVGSETDVNGSSRNFVAWNWLAGGSASSNSDGSITSSVSANTTAGFSIVTYTGTGSAATVGHGLGAVPKMFWTKRRDNNESWGVYHHTQGAGKFLRLESTNAVDTSSTLWNNTTPTSSVFSIAVGGIANTSSGTYVAYCFAEKKGYSKFGSYTGNGNADGTFVYTGLSPSFVLLKETSNANNWMIFDNKRSPFNLRDDFISPDISDAETTGNANNRMDMLSNGFKIRGTGSATNRSGSNFIFMAFASSPFTTSTGIPTTAR